jgi:hypothetical protein
MDDVIHAHLGLTCTHPPAISVGVHSPMAKPPRSNGLHSCRHNGLLLQTQWPSPSVRRAGNRPLAASVTWIHAQRAGLRPRGRRLLMVVAAIRGRLHPSRVSARQRCSTWCGLPIICSAAVGSRVHSRHRAHRCEPTTLNTTGDRSEQTWLYRTKRCGSPVRCGATLKVLATVSLGQLHA